MADTDRDKRAASRFDELDDNVKELLRKLEPEEVITLKYLSTIPRDELRGMMKTFRDFLAVQRFLRWSILTVLAIFIGAVTLGESISKIFAWIRKITS